MLRANFGGLQLRLFVWIIFKMRLTTTWIGSFFSVCAVFHVISIRCSWILDNSWNGNSIYLPCAVGSQLLFTTPTHPIFKERGGVRCDVCELWQTRLDLKTTDVRSSSLWWALKVPTIGLWSRSCQQPWCPKKNSNTGKQHLTYMGPSKQMCWC